ncbi:MAG: helix-turn-helix domain-containing protein [Coriobacteriales bacterium]
MERFSTTEGLGSAIRAERKAQGLTQTELADACDVSLSFIVGLEHGKNTAEIGKALLVLQTLGIDLYLKKRGE